jgi:ribokinase
MVSGDAPSGVALITVEAGGENRIAYVPGATSTVPSSHVTDALDAIEPGFVLATNELPHDALHGLFSRATAAGARVIFNATPDPATAVDLLANVSILVVNAGEAAALLGSGAIGDPRDAVLSLRDRGPETVILTAGPDGACAGFPGGVEWHRPPEVQVVDTTGAGDTFCGAFAAILANGGHISEAARFGVHASALSVTRHGAQSSIPARTEIDASLARHP